MAARAEKADGGRRREVLTSTQVRRIRGAYKRGDRKNNLSALASKYGVSLTTIWKVVHNETWRERET